MTKTAYVFLIVIVGLALLLHACDEASDREVIGDAASIALYDGVRTACEHRNHLRDGIWQTAANLHPESRRDAVRETLRFEDCDELGRKAVMRFQLQMKAKDEAEKTLSDLID